MANLAETIRQVGFFSGLSREDLARIAGKLEEQTVPSGQPIVKQGEAADALYLVQSGVVEVVLENGGLGVESLAILGPKECFGEMALFTGDKRSATVRAFIDSVILKLSKENWEELISKNPSLSLHFCKLLSHRLAETDQDVAKGWAAFNLVMEEFFSAQPADVRDFLIRSAPLKSLDPQVLRSVLSIENANELLTVISSKYPTFLHRDEKGVYEYRRYLHDFLTIKLSKTLDKGEERHDLDRRFASYFLSQGHWASAIYHYIRAEAWTDARELIRTHTEELLTTEKPKDLLELLEAFPDQLIRFDGDVIYLRSEAYLREGDLDAAINSYQDFLTRKRVSSADIGEAAQYYQRLAELYQKKGDIGKAMDCLRMTTGMLEQGKWNLEAVGAMQSIQALEQKEGSELGALQWAHRALNVSEKLTQVPSFLKGNKKWIGLLLALAVGLAIWHVPPPTSLGERGIHFLATLSTAILLWVFNVFDEYIVALLLLLSWVFPGIVPPETAVAGFSKSSWFFVIGVLGIGAAVTKSGLLYRVALQILHRVPPSYKIYTGMLSISGLLATPLLPEVKARIAIMAPISYAISETMGFRPRSNGSAGITLSAFSGFSQMTFVFLTGANTCIIGWSLLPETAKSEFGWLAWALAALPAGTLMLLALYCSVQYLFPLEEKPKAVPKLVQTQLDILGPLNRSEWLSIAILSVIIFGWLGKPLHGIDEAWIALIGFSLFVITGVLNKAGVKSGIDWSYLIFVGVVTSLGSIIPALGIDLWLREVVKPALLPFSFHPIPFLLMVALLVYLVRFYLNKNSAVVIVSLSLSPWAQEIGIHPGVFLLTILMAVESWFLPHQTPSYQIAYFSTDEKAFSHAQARKVMLAKFVASFAAIAVSVPYWQLLGFIR